MIHIASTEGDTGVQCMRVEQQCATLTFSGFIWASVRCRLGTICALVQVI